MADRGGGEYSTFSTSINRIIPWNVDVTPEFIQNWLVEREMYCSRIFWAIGFSVRELRESDKIIKYGYENEEVMIFFKAR